MTEVDLNTLRQWVGRSERSADVVTPRLVASLRATIDLDAQRADSTKVPATIHWCLAPQIEPMLALGRDGHPARGSFLPPVALPRRMWAMSEIMFHDPLRVGDEVVRVSRIADVAMKTGRSGPLCFVTVQHELTTARGLAVSERQDILYRDHAVELTVAKTPPPMREGQWHREIRPDPVLLFRYSALTFNGHRIHYDRDYCREREGYPGLIVHGPLQASYLLEFATVIRRRTPGRFSCRAVAPAFDTGLLTLNADESDDGLQLWAANQEGRPTMQAQASW